MSRKPSIERGVADRYAVSGEAIFEFSAGKRGKRLGGLIAIRTVPTDTGEKVIVELYRLDEGVEVRTAPERDIV
jgi:hypothetical protein